MKNVNSSLSGDDTVQFLLPVGAKMHYWGYARKIRDRVESITKNNLLK